MEDPKTIYANEFFRANKIFYIYLLISHFALFTVTILFWMFTFQVYQGVYVYWLFCKGYFALYLPIIPFSVIIFKKSQKLNFLFDLKDIKQYGKQKLVSNLILSILAFFFLFFNILSEYYPDWFWWNLFYQLQGYFYPFDAQSHEFISQFVVCFYANTNNTLTIIGNAINWVSLIVPITFIIGIFLNISSYGYIRRILLKFVRDETNYSNILMIFKKLFVFLILYLLTLILFYFTLYRDPMDPSINKHIFTNISGSVVFYFLILYNFIKIFRKMEKIPLNFNFNTFLSRKKYRLERDITFSDHAFFFEPQYIVDHQKESRGLKPGIGVAMMIIGIPAAIISFLFVFNNIYGWVNWGYYFPKWLFLSLGFMIVFIVLVMTGIILSSRYFQIERTPTEMMFQKGFQKDHIPLNQIQEIAVDYKIVGTNERGVKVRITISLLIPDHIICISKDISMVFLKLDKVSFESHLVKVLTKTLFILGYTPK